MQRTVRIFPLETPPIKRKLLSWSQKYHTIVWLDSNAHQQPYSDYESILAVEEFTSIKIDCFNAFDQLKEYQTITQDFIFGYIGYDVKNDIEKLHSENHDGLGFQICSFSNPKRSSFLKKPRLNFITLK